VLQKQVTQLKEQVALQNKYGLGGVDYALGSTGSSSARGAGRSMGASPRNAPPRSSGRVLAAASAQSTPRGGRATSPRSSRGGVENDLAELVRESEARMAKPLGSKETETVVTRLEQLDPEAAAQVPFPPSRPQSNAHMPTRPHAHTHPFPLLTRRCDPALRADCGEARRDGGAARPPQCCSGPECGREDGREQL